MKAEDTSIIMEILKRKIQNLIATDLISPLFWEDFTNELLAQFRLEVSEITDELQNYEGAFNSIKSIIEDMPELDIVNHDQVRIFNEALNEIYTIIHQFKSRR